MGARPWRRACAGRPAGAAASAHLSTRTCWSAPPRTSTAAARYGRCSSAPGAAGAGGPPDEGKPALQLMGAAAPTRARGARARAGTLLSLGRRHAGCRRRRTGADRHGRAAQRCAAGAHAEADPDQRGGPFGRAAGRLSHRRPRDGLPLRVLEIGASAASTCAGTDIATPARRASGVTPAPRCEIAEAFTGGRPRWMCGRRSWSAGVATRDPLDPASEDTRLHAALVHLAGPAAALHAAACGARLRPVDAGRGRARERRRMAGGRAGRPRPGVATVVFHSVVLPYLGEEGIAELWHTLDAAAGRARPDAPLAWLSLEAGADLAAVRLMTWPGGEARCSPTRASTAPRDVSELIQPRIPLQMAFMPPVVAGSSSVHPGRRNGHGRTSNTEAAARTSRRAGGTRARTPAWRCCSSSAPSMSGTYSASIDGVSDWISPEARLEPARQRQLQLVQRRQRTLAHHHHDPRLHDRDLLDHPRHAVRRGLVGVAHRALHAQRPVDRQRDRSPSRLKLFISAPPLRP